MTRSGSFNYNVTASDIMTEARELIGSLDAGGTITSDESTSDLRTLNMMLKALQSKGIGLWLNKECWLFLQDETIKYLIGLRGDHCAIDAVKTELAADAAAAAVSITVDSITGVGNTFDSDGIYDDLPAATTPLTLTLAGALVTSGVAYLTSERYLIVSTLITDESATTFTITGTDGNGAAVTEILYGGDQTSVYSANTYKTVTSIVTTGVLLGAVQIGQVGDPIGIELDDGTVQWTYINAAVTTTAITVFDVLTDAATTDNHVYTYTEETPRPIDIVEARLVNNSGYERPLRIAGRHEYMALSDKTTEATPNLIYYDKQLDSGVMYVWPEPSDVKEYIKFTGRLPIQDIDATTNNFEVGQELFECLAWNLAWRIAPKYGKKIDSDFRMSAEQMLQEAMISDAENTSVFIRIMRR